MFLSTFESELFWVNVTNVGLGLLVAACVLAVAGAVVVELRARRRKRIYL